MTINLSDRQESLDEAIATRLQRLKPAERRVARLLVENRHAVLLGSAAQIGALAGTSDATVVRTARSLGFNSLTALRESLLNDLTKGLSPKQRLQRSLDQAASDGAGALGYVLRQHELVLDVLRQPRVAEVFDRSVILLAGSRCRHVFGIGPSAAMAEYAVLQFRRIGLNANALSASGVALADSLLPMERGDAVLMLAYAPLYREVEVVLAETKRLDIPVVLVSDSLGPLISDLVTEIIPLPRGRADHLAMHGGTTILIEALVVALASMGKEGAMENLVRLSRLRGEIDPQWIKRGITPPTKNRNSPNSGRPKSL